MLVSHLPNVRYLCGFSGSAGLLLIDERTVTLFTDSRYTFQARQEVHGARVHIAKHGLTARSRRRTERKAAPRAPWRTRPATRTVAQKQALEAFRGAGCGGRATKMWSRSFARVKDAGELARMRDAAHLISGVFRQDSAAHSAGDLRTRAGRRDRIPHQAKRARPVPRSRRSSPRARVPHGPTRVPRRSASAKANWSSSTRVLYSRLLQRHDAHGLRRASASAGSANLPSGPGGPGSGEAGDPPGRDRLETWIARRADSLKRSRLGPVFHAQHRPRTGLGSA